MYEASSIYVFILQVTETAQVFLCCLRHKTVKKIYVHVSPFCVATYLASLFNVSFLAAGDWGVHQVEQTKIYFHLTGRCKNGDWGVRCIKYILTCSSTLSAACQHFTSSSDHLCKRDSAVKHSMLGLWTETIFAKGTWYSILCQPSHTLIFYDLQILMKEE